MVRSLAERLRAHEQQKARLAEQEAKLKDAGRKARTRRLIEAGGLIDKAGLFELEPNALYGALLSLRDGAGDKDQISQWTALGGRAFAREARLRDEGKEAVVLAFPAALAKDITAALRQAGFRFSKVLQHWEGLARFDEAERLAAAHGGTARRVAAIASASSSQSTAAAAADSPSDSSGGTGGATGGGTTGGDTGGSAGGGTGGTVSPPEPPPAVPPEPQPVSPPESPGLTLDQYHKIVVTDFVNYWLAHPEVVFNGNAMIAFATETTSTTVLTSPVPGDLWS